MRQSKQLTEKQQEALLNVWEDDPFNNSRSGTDHGVRLKTLRYLITTGHIREHVEFEDGRATKVNYKLTMAGREKLFALIDDDDVIAKLTWVANQIRTNLQLRLAFFGCAGWLDFAAARIMDASIPAQDERKIRSLFVESSMQQAKGRRKTCGVN